MSGLKYFLLALLLSTVPASAEHKVCGSPPEFEKKSSETSKTLGDLEGKAAGFAKLLGSAELGGRVTTERQTIYKDNQPAEAARYDAYLAYIFCVTIMDDAKADMAAKLKALQEFRKPVSELTLPEKVHLSLNESVLAASQRAREEATKARAKASNYPRKDVEFSLKRVSELEQSVRKKFVGEPVLDLKSGKRYWGEASEGVPNGVGRDCCSAADFIGEYIKGRFGEYGKLTQQDGEYVGKIAIGHPGTGCLSSRSGRWCGTFTGENAKDGTLIMSGVIMVQYFDDDGRISGFGFGELNPAEDNLLSGPTVFFFFPDGVADEPVKVRYEGEFARGDREGYGVLYYIDGTRYEGQWRGGKILGFGQKISIDGKVIAAGFWQDDRIQIRLL